MAEALIEAKGGAQVVGDGAQDRRAQLVGLRAGFGWGGGLGEIAPFERVGVLCSERVEDAAVVE